MAVSRRRIPTKRAKIEVKLQLLQMIWRCQGILLLDRNHVCRLHFIFSFLMPLFAVRLGDSAGEGLVPLSPSCGICGDSFIETFSPLSASLSANSSTRLPFGLRLPCPNQHSYCVGCLSRYIICKLDPD